ncbi:hypothetical protein FRC02_001752 [Tulasnella sp. 418]|nr:hypothetical protein FRC02_001752 [Tulasnella sp. 418]
MRTWSGLKSERYNTQVLHTPLLMSPSTFYLFVRLALLTPDKVPRASLHGFTLIHPFPYRTTPLPPPPPQ